MTGRRRRSSATTTLACRADAPVLTRLISGRRVLSPRDLQDRAPVPPQRPVRPLGPSFARMNEYSRSRCQSAIAICPENVLIRSMYSAAVYTISQSNCRTCTSENSPLASMSSATGGSSPGRGRGAPAVWPAPISSDTSCSLSKIGSPSSGNTCPADQRARWLPGRSAAQARGHRTAGSIQCQAVAAKAKPNRPATGGRHDSNDPPPPTRRNRSGWPAPPGPDRAQLDAGDPEARRASGSVALPVAQRISRMRSPGGSAVTANRSSYSAAG